MIKESELVLYIILVSHFAHCWFWNFFQFSPVGCSPLSQNVKIGSNMPSRQTFWEKKKRNLFLIRVILSVGFNTNQRENSEINYFLKFIKCLTLRMSLYLLSLIGILVIIIIQQLCKVFTSLTTNGVIIHSVHVLQCVLEIVALASETN